MILINSVCFSFVLYLPEGKEFLGHRPIVNGVPQGYEWQTYDKVKERVTAFGAGLSHLGLAPTGKLGIFAINRPEWVRPRISFFVNNWKPFTPLLSFHPNTDLDLKKKGSNKLTTPNV